MTSRLALSFDAGTLSDPSRAIARLPEAIISAGHSYTPFDSG